jgi:hypothetical protein
MLRDFFGSPGHIQRNRRAAWHSSPWSCRIHLLANQHQPMVKANATHSFEATRRNISEWMIQKHKRNVRSQLHQSDRD